MKLSNIRKMGRFKNTETGQTYNIHKGRYMTRGTDVLFYLYKGKRIFISDYDYFHIHMEITNKT